MLLLLLHHFRGRVGEKKLRVAEGCRFPAKKNAGGHGGKLERGRDPWNGRVAVPARFDSRRREAKKSQRDAMRGCDAHDDGLVWGEGEGEGGSVCARVCVPVVGQGPRKGCSEN